MIFSDFKFYKVKCGLVGTIVNVGFWSIIFYRIGHRLVKSKYKSINPFWYLFILIFNLHTLMSKIEISLHAKIGNNLFLPHPHGLVIGVFASIGNNCTISPWVVIGHNGIPEDQPTIENNVYIAAHAVIVGKLTVGDDTIIGANTVVTKNIPANSVVSINKSVQIKERKSK